MYHNDWLPSHHTATQLLMCNTTNDNRQATRPCHAPRNNDNSAGPQACNSCHQSVLPPADVNAEKSESQRMTRYDTHAAGVHNVLAAEYNATLLQSIHDESI
jgi:hypothetical protein